MEPGWEPVHSVWVGPCTAGTGTALELPSVGGQMSSTPELTCRMPWATPKGYPGASSSALQSAASAPALHTVVHKEVADLFARM